MNQLSYYKNTESLLLALHYWTGLRNCTALLAKNGVRTWHEDNASMYDQYMYIENTITNCHTDRIKYNVY